jgi:hypothetical protein
MKRTFGLGRSLALAAAIGCLPMGSLLGQESAAPAKSKVVGHSAQQSDEAVSITFDLGSGEQVRIAIDGTMLFVNGEPVADIATGGALDRALRALALGFGTSNTADAVSAVRGLQEIEVEAAELAAQAAVLSAVDGLAAAEALLPELADIPEIVAGTPPRPERAPRIALERFGNSPLEPDVGVVGGGPSLVGGIAGAVVNLGAVYLAMCFMGLGLLIFAPRQLEVVADTVWHSFGRSFLAGLFAQPLLLPVFGTMIVGLAMTVVGILVIPFAALAFLAAFVLAAVGGFVAVARTAGEIYLRRKMARGVAIQTWGSFRYIVYGLAGLSAIWLPAVLLGSVPVAGPLFTGTAALATWVLATAGFGATLISRAGVRGTFVRKLDLALTDEQYWTDEDVPTPYRSSSASRR